MEGKAALRRFRRYSAAARMLERAKDMHMGHVSDDLRSLGWCEDMLEDAWREVGDLEELAGDRSASLVASHFLLLDDWRTAASEGGLSTDKAKKLAYAALRLLDAREEER